MDLKAQNARGQTPLHIAIETWQTAVALDLILSGESDLSAKDRYGRTPFLLAVALGQSIIVEQLLNVEDDFDPDDADRDGNTAVHWAAKLSDATILRMLNVSGRFDFKLTNRKEMTPLMIAEENMGQCYSYLVNRPVSTREEEAIYEYSAEEQATPQEETAPEEETTPQEETVL